MAQQRLIVVLPIGDFNDSLVPLEPVQCESIEKARAVARKLAVTHAGVLAWWRDADPDTGEYGPPHEIVRIGRIPDDLE